MRTFHDDSPTFIGGGRIRVETYRPPALGYGVSIADLLSYAFPFDSLTVVAVGRVIMVFETANY